jgi:hypothetical protein
MRGMRTALPCLAAALLSACGSADATRPAVTVTDSSGVRITTTAASDGAYADVVARPTLSLGGADAERATLFFNVRGLHLDRRGAVWVADRGTNEVRVFAADGTHQATAGRTGDGPGEFRQIRLLGPLAGDSIAVWDDASQRMSVFTPDGTIARTVVPTGPADAVLPTLVRVLPDGSFLGWRTRVFDARSLSPGQLLPATTELFTFDGAGTRLASQGSVGGPVWLWTGRMQVPIPFTIPAAYDVDDGGAIHVAEGAEFRIRVLRDGRLTESYGVEREPRPVTPADVAAYRQFYEDNLADPATRRAYVGALEHAGLPARLPAYARVLIAADGATWAQIYASDPLAPATWDVFGTDRAWLGQVTTPAGFVVEQIVVRPAAAGSALLGVWRDPLGVEHVRVYSLTR